MPIVDGVTAEKAQEIENASVVTGEITASNGHLLLTTAGESIIDAGLVRDDAALAYIQSNIDIVVADEAATRAELAEVNPSVRIALAGLYILNHNVGALIPMNETYDTDGMHPDDGSGGNFERLTCVIPGVYLVTGQIGFASNPTGFRELQIMLNGTTTSLCVVRSIPINGVVSFLTGSALVRLGVGDYVALRGFQNSGTSLQPSITDTWLQATRVSP